MTRAAWFKPVVGMLTAIAVGVGAAVLALQLATPADVAPTIGTVPATVIPGSAPVVAAADSEAEPDPSEPAPSAPTSDAPAVTVEVPDPAALPEADPAAPVVPAALVDTLEESAASDDPLSAAELWAFRLRGLTLPTLDPCVLDPGREGCPSGTVGVVLGGDLPDLTARLGLGTCSRPDGTNLAIQVQTNAPATAIRIAAVSGDLVVEETLRTEDEWLERYEPGMLVSIRHCLATTGWERDARVDVTAAVTDVFGRETAVSMTLSVLPSVTAVRPEAQLLGIGVNMVRVSVPFESRSGQQVRLGWVEPDEECVFRGDGADMGEAWSVGRWIEEDIPEAYALEKNWVLSYDRRSTADFVVPTGSVLRLCVGWYDGGEGDVAGRPQWRNEVIVAAPAAALPVATLTEVDVSGSEPVSIRGSLPAARCGGWAAPAALPAPICDVPAVAPWFGASGFITITTESGGRSENFALDAFSAVCHEVACGPRSQEFPVPVFDRGTAIVRVDWPAVAGPVWWDFSEEAVGPYTELAGDAPLMDTGAEWTIDRGFDSFTGMQRVSFPLTTDRPVTVRVTLEGPCTVPGQTLTYVDAELRPWTDRHVVFENVCMGAGYHATVELTDAEGDVTRYAYLRDGHRLWAGAAFVTRPMIVDLPIKVQIVPPELEFYSVASSELSRPYGWRTTASTPRPDDERCTYSGATLSYRVNDVRMLWSDEYVLRLQLVEGSVGPAGAVSPDGFTDCRTTGGETHEIVVPFTATRADFATGGWIEHTDPATGILIRIRFEPTLFR